jgi:hypothetical protein
MVHISFLSSRRLKAMQSHCMLYLILPRVLLINQSRAKPKGQAAWDQKFKELYEFKQLHGDCECVLLFAGWSIVISFLTTLTPLGWVLLL